MRVHSPPSAARNSHCCWDKAPAFSAVRPPACREPHACTRSRGDCAIRALRPAAKRTNTTRLRIRVRLSGHSRLNRTIFTAELTGVCSFSVWNGSTAHASSEMAKLCDCRRHTHTHTHTQNPRIPESQNPRIPESQNPRIPESQNPRNQFVRVISASISRTSRGPFDRCSSPVGVIR